MIVLRYITLSLLSLLLPLCYMAQAQEVGGVRSTLAYTDVAEKLQVHLTLGSPEYFIIPGEATDQIRRYSTDALQAEPVVAEFVAGQKVWRISKPQTGCGYFAASDARLPRYYYLIDYTPYQLDLGQLHAIPLPSDPCMRIKLWGDRPAGSITYYTPSGKRRELDRQLQVRYRTLLWDAEQRTYTPHQVQTQAKSTAEGWEVEASLEDTSYTLLAEQWHKDLGLPTYQIESSTVITERIQTNAMVELEEADPNSPTDWENISAPTTLRLSVVGNAPSAAKYQWRIEREGEPTPLLNYAGEEVTYRLERSGRYRIFMEGINRSGTCIDNGFEFTLRVVESKLDIPNAFTPGSSEGINDVFRVVARSLTRFDAYIFSASGQELYHWTDPNGGWNGTYRGQIVPSGAYYYVIVAEGSDGVKYNRRGTVSVLKSRFDAPMR